MSNKKRLFQIGILLVVVLALGLVSIVNTAPVCEAKSEKDYSAVFSAEYYRNKYADLDKAFGKDYKKLLQHFVSYGMSEGRQANEEFNVKFYRANYKDLENAFGNNLKKYYEHYISYGKKEGRIANRDLIKDTEMKTDKTVGQFDFENKNVLLNSGYYMPINGIGTYSLLDETCVNSVKEALKNGVRLIDTAYMYHNEEAVGQAIREAMTEYGIKREEIFVITKLYPGEQFSNPEKAIEQALKKLDIGYIDMMLLHHPGTNDVKAYLDMEKYAKDGKIRSLGLSNWYIKELKEFLPKVNIKPALVQNEIHPYYQESEVVDYIHSLGIVVQGWYPLGGRGYTAELLGDETIVQIAKKHGVSSAQVILRWDLQNGVVVIPGSSNPDHILENTQLYDFELTDSEMAKIKALNRDEKHDWY